MAQTLVVDGTDLTAYPADRRIAAVAADARAVYVTWDDGRRSVFHNLWLRDNCACAQCRHPEALERTFDLLSVPENLRAAEAGLDGGVLRVVWAQDGHVSAYRPGWLRAHDYGAAAREERRERPVLWDSRLTGRVPAVAYAGIMASDRALLEWLRLLRDYGVCIVSGVPAETRAAARAALRVAPLQRTQYGTTWDVVAKPEPISTAFTPIRLTCHMDLPYWESPPGYQFLHCLCNEAAGGESVVVDGFAVAGALRRDEPEAFDLLARVALPFRFVDRDTDLRYRAPAIGLHPDGEVREIRFSIALMDALDAPAHLMEALYRAYRKMAAMIREPQFEVRFRLEAGQMLVFDNRRILHGREAFDPRTGRRHLAGCYLLRDDLLSRIRVLERGLPIR
ncbi:MAG: TauD/TfdA family dioxygenase [Kiloniellaceae bacterium]